MTQPPEQEYTPPPPAPPSQTTRLQPPRRSCLSRAFGFVGWVVSLALAVALALAAGAALLYYYFGLDLNTPGQLRQASSDVFALQGQAQALQTEVTLLSTADASRSSDLASARERVDELEQQLQGYQQQATALIGQAATAGALADELDQGMALAATLQTGAREDQVLVSVFATAQSDNSQRIDEVQRRTDRILRFLERISDLAGDTTTDLSGSATPSTTSPVATATALVTPTAAEPATTPTAAEPATTPTAAQPATTPATTRTATPAPTATP